MVSVINSKVWAKFIITLGKQCYINWVCSVCIVVVPIFKVRISINIWQLVVHWWCYLSLVYAVCMLAVHIFIDRISVNKWPTAVHCGCYLSLVQRRVPHYEDIDFIWKTYLLCIIWEICEHVFFLLLPMDSYIKVRYL